MNHAFPVQCLDYVQNTVWVWLFLTSSFANSLEKSRTSFFWTTAMVFVVFFYLQYPIPITSILHMTVGCYFKKCKSNNFTFLLNSSKSCSWHLYNFKVFIFFFLLCLLSFCPLFFLLVLYSPLLFKTYQTCSCLKAFELAVPSDGNALFLVIYVAFSSHIIKDTFLLPTPYPALFLS